MPDPDRPRLRDDLLLKSVFRRGLSRTVVKDALAGSHYEFGHVEGCILRLLDGSRSLGHVRRKVVEEIRGIDLPETTLRSFVETLRRRRLIEDGRAARDEALLDRRRRRARARPRSLGDLFFWRVPLGDPSRLLDRLEPAGRLLFAPPFAAVALLVSALAAAVVVADWNSFLAAAKAPLAAASPGLLLAGYAVAIFGVALHELGHAFACRRYGGQVQEVGFLLIFGMPCLYCDVSDAWMFANRRERAIVTLAGPYVHLLTAAAGAIVFAFSAPGSAAGALGAAYAATVCVATLLFNLNPFLKFDGYYLLVDALDRPNLDKEAFAEAGRFLAGLAGQRDEASSPRRPGLVVFAFAATIYRIGLVAGMALLALRLAGGGLLGSVALVALPLLAYRAHRKVSRLTRALRPSAPVTARPWMALPVLGLVAMVWLNPVVARRATIEARVEPVGAARLSAPRDGRVRALPRRGTPVRRGQALLTLEDGETLRAPVDGFVGWVTDLNEVRRGEPILRIDSDRALIVRAEGPALAGGMDVVLRRYGWADDSVRGAVRALPSGGFRFDLTGGVLTAPPLEGERALLRLPVERRVRDVLASLARP